MRRLLALAFVLFIATPASAQWSRDQVQDFRDRAADNQQRQQQMIDQQRQQADQALRDGQDRQWRDTLQRQQQQQNDLGILLFNEMRRSTR